MQPQQRKRIIDRHRDSLKRHGHHPHALYWSNQDIQELRFAILAEAGLHTAERVLDVGCGFGDFHHWAKDLQLDYYGLDLSPDLLSLAKKQHPKAHFFCGTLSDFYFADQSFDRVILSGALNEQLHDEGAYAKASIRHMYRLCKKSLAFNLLNAKTVQAHDLQSFYPDDIVHYCKQFCSKVQLRDHYLKNDFSIYMYR